METGKSGDFSANGTNTGIVDITIDQVDPESESESNVHDVLGNLKNTTYLYRQDIVRSNCDSKIGVVMEVAGDSDSDSDSSITDDDDGDEDDEDDNDDDDDDEDNEDVENDDVGNDHATNTDENKESGNHKSDPLSPDQVRVHWIDETETIENLNEVTVLDRAFLHGDYVAAASDPTGQVGVVVDVNISVDLLTTDGSIISDLPSRDLKRVRDFTVGDYVVHGTWLGRVDDVLDNVTVLFGDGSMCKVMKADPLRLKPVGGYLLEDSHFPFYPGQRVKGTSSSVFKNARWLSGLWKANRLEGTVTKVTVGSVFIYWIASAGYGPDSSSSPAEEQNPKNLTLLSCFSHANWQLGDWCLYTKPPLSSSIHLAKDSHDATESGLNSDEGKHGCISEMVSQDEPNENGETMEVDVENELDSTSNPIVESSSCSSSVSVSKEPIHETWPLHRKKIRKVVVRRDKKTRKRDENFERAAMIVNTKSRVDVAWQDGTIGRALDSISLIPIDSPGDHEFVAEQYVVEKAADDGNDSCDVRRVGLVKSVNAKERTACVRWLKPVSRAEDPREFDKEEMVSVYELEGHQDYDYCYGDVVVRLTPVSLMTTLAESKRVADDPNGDLVNCNEDKKIVASSNAEFSDLSWVGNITGLMNGDIEVTWADGMVSLVGPQAIYVVGRDDDDSITAGSDISNEAASWETVDDDEMDTLDEVNEEPEQQDVAGTTPKSEDSTTSGDNPVRNGPLSIPLAALGFVTRIASGIFSRGRKDQESSYEQEHEATEGPVGDSTKDLSSHSSYTNDNSANITRVENEDNNVIEPVDLEAAEVLCSLSSKVLHSSSANEDGISGFKGFDISKDPTDHYYIGANRQSNAGRKWLRKVQQDWSILQNNLPDGIYVRVYEDRMDLIRAVIVGAYSTPYQDGLFFFDFHLPPEYPDVPPTLYYHSGGWRINPNLYEEGKVCLSLLNTWTGKGNEVWDPSASSILQVLVSLQGLVLNAKPYFNEAGYDKQVGTAEGEKNSLSYNENTFLLNCKTMMYLMRRPPKDFEELVKEHFRNRGPYILKACDAYLKGNLIGSLSKDASAINTSDESSANANSVGFKLMLAKILPKLFTALKEIGADCDDDAYKHLQQL